MNRRITIIDAGSVMHAAKHSLGKSRLSHNEKNTFVIYGFLLKIRSIVDYTCADILVFAFDSDHSVRKSLYSGYKEKRQTKTPEQKALDALSYPQFEEIENFVIPSIGWRNVFKAKGFEADDIIGRLCKKYRHDYITIVTTDKDMYQLLTPNISILNSKKHTIYTDKDFISDYGIEPKMWKRVKTYGGCTSDDVPGLPVPGSTKGIGEKTAINYITGKLPSHHKAYKAFIVPENKKIISRNKSLVILPHRKCPEFTIMPERTLYQQGLSKVVREYGFNSITMIWNEFCKALKLKVKK